MTGKWKLMRTGNLSSGFKTGENFDDASDMASLRKIVKEIQGRRSFSTYASVENEGVDLKLMHGLEVIRNEDMRIPIIIEAYDHEAGIDSLMTLNFYDVRMVHRPMYDMDGYTLHFAFKGEMEVEEF